MKQSAAKTLGVAALGAAFAAVAAGSASAAVAAPALPDATQALGTVTHTLPAENVAKALPGVPPHAARVPDDVRHRHRRQHHPHHEPQHDAVA
ncbi:hypothetical protein AB0M61_48915, partial [Streptomyces sp. NPDC051642]